MAREPRAQNEATKRKARSDSELHRASMAVQYEVVTLGTTLQQLLHSNVTCEGPARERLISNALLHTFLLAARNLIHFLFSHEPRPNDIIAQDFVDHAAHWSAQQSACAPELRDGALVTFISRRLAHLTYDRASGTKATWGPFAIAWLVLEGLERFVVVADKSRVDKRLVDEVQLVGQLLRTLRAEFGGLDTPLGPLSTLLPWDDFDLDLP
jgi:hypothetical protein